MEKQDVINYLWNAQTREELIELNGILRERLKQLEAQQVFNFHVGEKVKWKGKRGYEITGIIKQINKTTISIDAGDHGPWRVPPSMLMRVG